MKLIVGLVFALLSISAGAQHTKLVDFTGPNGYEPWGSLIYDGTFLYGMTQSGGANNLGTIFKVHTDGTGFVTILDFAGATNGSYPLGSLFSDGTFMYGMTSSGGTANEGTVFKIMPDGTGYVKLLDFAGATNGNDPYGSLISDGTFLYGMTAAGGANNMGTIFKIMKDGSGYIKLLDFSGAANGANPYGDLLLIGTTLYGLTSAGGTNGDGTVFRIGINGTGYVRMLNFAGFPFSGEEPISSLIYDGTYLYGTTAGGGAANDGTVFKIRPDGSGFVVIKSFELTQGDSPFGSLIFVGPALYGMTYFGGEGGTYDYGTIFRILPNGLEHAKLFDFNIVARGLLPNGALISDGTFLYGMTQQGGTGADGGTLFKFQILPPPTITSFTPPSGVVGTAVTITGTNFSATPASNTVMFNGIPATVTASTATSITTSVPSGAATGPITVTVTGNTATSATNFIVTGSPPAHQFDWVKQFVTTDDAVYESMTTDPAGNVYTVGYFSETTDFDPGSGVFNLTSAGNSDIFISKLNAQGEFAWALRFGATTGDEARAVASDAAGNIYVTGVFGGTVDFDPGPGITALTGTAMFTCKFDTNGNLLWANQLSSNLAGNPSIILDPTTDDVYISGGFTGTNDFDPGAPTVNLVSAGSSDIYILKLSSAGGFMWARRMGSTGNDIANKIALDATGNVLTTGSFNATVDFDPGAGTANLTTAGLNDVFISKLTAAGNYVWARRVGGTTTFDVGYGIATDAGSNVLITGTFIGPVDFDPGAGVNNINSGGNDTFVLKLDAAGIFQWAKTVGGIGSDLGWSIAADAAGYVYVSGEYSQTADFNPGPGVYGLTASGSEEAYVVKLDPNGNFQWTWSTTGTSSTSQIPVISLGPSGDIVIAGTMEDGSVDFDPGICVVGFASGPSIGSFVVKLSTTAAPCTPAVTNFTPFSGIIGTEVTITGTNFSPTPANNFVMFNGSAAVVTASSSTSITTIVPAGATTGPVSVTVGFLTGTSSTNFTVIIPSITFSTQPSSTSACTGGSSTIAVVASGDSNLLYQWQVDNAGFVNLSNDVTYSGVNTATLTISNPSAALHGSTYRVLVHGDNTTDTPSAIATLTVNTSPAAPGVSGATTGCAPLSATLTASGAADGQYRWYTVLTGGSAIPGEVNSTFNTPSLSVTTSYFASINDGTCESSRNEVTVTVDAAAPGPVTTGAARCGPGSVVLNATGSSAGNYRWYDAATGGSSLPGEVNSIFTTPSLNITTSHYVSAINGSCESARSEVIATINTIPSPPTAVGRTACSGSAVTIGATGGVSGQYRWYATATGGTPVAGEVNGSFITPALTATVSYFVSIHNGTCESSRTEVIASVAAIPAAPTAATPLPVCPSASVTLTASGGTNGNYRWYDGSTLITAEVNSTYLVSSLAATKTFGVAVVNGSCESAKTLVTASVSVCTPPAIISNAIASFIDGVITIDLRPLISDPENNLDESTLQVEAGLTSGAPVTLNGFLLTIDYTGISYPRTDVLTIRICDLTTMCTSQAVTIELTAGLVVYNALSPNDDGKNDVFYIQDINILTTTKSNKVSILNRWGDVVFEVEDYDNDTNAFRGLNKNGNELPAGTYYYKIEFTSGTASLTGFISLKR